MWVYSFLFTPSWRFLKLLISFCCSIISSSMECSPTSANRTAMVLLGLSATFGSAYKAKSGISCWQSVLVAIQCNSCSSANGINFNLSVIADLQISAVPLSWENAPCPWNRRLYMLTWRMSLRYGFLKQNLSGGTWSRLATLRIQNNPARNKSKSQTCANILLIFEYDMFKSAWHTTQCVLPMPLESAFWWL